MKYVWATGTNRGLMRPANEDVVLPPTSGSAPGPVLIGVADGMGGHVAGEIASSTAMAAATEQPATADVDLAERIMAGNAAVLAVGAEQPALRGMGTTMTLGRFGEDGKLEIGHVGDSRAYLRRGGTLRRLTTDHTVVEELVGLGHIPREAAAGHPRRHLLTRTLGLGPVEVDEITVELEPGDTVLFCTDGLTEMVDDEKIDRLLAEADAPEAAVWSLIEAANAAGGVDNISVAVVDVVP